MATNHVAYNQAECPINWILPVRDALDVLSGKWKLPIIASLIFGNKPFNQIARDIPGITDKILSKELKDPEQNQLIKHTLYDGFPPFVEYPITEHGLSLQKLIGKLREWGVSHQVKIMEK